MWKAWLFSLTVLVLCAGPLLAADGGSGMGPAHGDKSGGSRAAPIGKRPVTRAEMAAAIARALAEGEEKIPPPPPAPSYRDVPRTHWAYRYIEYAASMGVVSGYADGSYRPDAPVTRAQMAVFLARALLAPEGDIALLCYVTPIDPTFGDVPPEHWAYMHIEYLADPDLDIAQGDPDGSFHPEQLCTREEMAALVARAFPPPPPATSPTKKQSAGQHP